MIHRRIILTAIALLLVGTAAEAATYYVSSEATNGYAVGSDANNGTSKATPFLTLDPFEAGGFSWSDDDTIYLNGAEVNCSAGLTLDGTVTIQGDVDKTQINMRSVTGGAYGILFANGKSATFRHCVIDRGGCTTAPINPTTATTKATVVFDDVEIIYNAWGIYSATAALKIDLTMTDCKFTSSYTAGAGNSPLYLNTLGATSEIDLNGIELDLSHAAVTSIRGGIILKATAADIPCSIQGVTGQITRTSGTTYVYGIWLSDFATALIADCDLTINSAVASSAASLYRITSATQAVTSAIIRDNRGRVTAPGGIMIVAGEDGTANEADGVQVYGNWVQGPSNYTSLHGILAGGNENCKVYDNRVDYADIAFISKNSTGHVVSHNIARFQGANAEAFRMKGAVNCSFVNNGHICEGVWNGRTVYITNNDGLPNSTGGVVAGNWRHEMAGTTTSAYVCVIDVDQTANFYGNVWYSHDGLGAAPFDDHGTDRTLAEWQAQAAVFGDVAFEFSPRQRVNLDRRLLSLMKGL